MEAISRNAWNKFNDPDYGQGNPEEDALARQFITPEQVWDSLCRIDKAEGTTPVTI